jgi:hypothetical protein
LTDHASENRGREGREFTADYLRQLEEGEILPTPEDLDVLSNVYGLDDVQRRYLYHLYSYEVNGPAPIPEIAVSDDHRRRVDAHSPYPAAVLDHRWNVVYANPGYVRVLRGIAADNNFVTWMFLDDNARSIVIDFTAEARQLVGRFRFAAGVYLGDPQFDDLEQRCCADNLFAKAFEEPSLLADGPGPIPMNWRDPDSGEILRVTEQRLPDSEWLTLHSAIAMG